MFMITAIIQPSQLPLVRAALLEGGITGMTVTECAGHGRDPQMVASLRGGPELGYLEDNLQIEVAVPDAAKDAAMESIRRGASMGQRGKIFVSYIERVISIRSGLEDDLALNAPGHVWFEAAE